jgi:hypothetical protein
MSWGLAANRCLVQGIANMAVELGGRSDKLGNRYEGLWVARNLLLVLAGEAVAVTIEAIGDDEEGVDLWVDYLDGRREAHQCKRKNRNIGKWTMAELRTRKVLTKLAIQLARNVSYHFVLVSCHDAPDLRILCDLARNSGNDYSAFWQTAESTEDCRAALRAFCVATTLDPALQAHRQTAYDFLQRSDVRVFDDGRSGRQDVALLARLSVSGNPQAVAPLLADFAQDRMGHALHADQIRAYLRDKHHAPRDLTGEPTLVPRIEQLRAEFRGSLRPTLIGGSLIPRVHAGELREALRTPNGRLVVIHGRAGSGKSAVLLDLSEQLEAEGVPYLSLRLDRRTPQVSARQFGTSICDLPDSPALSLRALAGSREAILILDQLDAIRWTTAHGSAHWEACQEVMDEALLLPRLRVVVACRTFDLRDDELIRSWLTNHKGQRIEVGHLPEEDVRRIIDQAGGQFGSLRPAQRLLLRSPICLSLWAELARDGQPPTSFTTAAELMRAFWRMRRRHLQTMGVGGSEVDAALGAVVSRIDRDGSAHAPERLLDNYPTAKVALLSLNLVSVSEGRVTFTHQTFFEYLFATRLLDEIHSSKEALVVWLKRSDQSLFRREQLRQLLVLLRDESHQNYLTAVTEILSDTAIRFHLKHLALRFLGDVPNPTPAEIDCVQKLFRDAAWRDNVLETVLWGRATWFAALDDSGFIRELLASPEQRDREVAIQLMRPVAGHCGDRIANLLTAYEAEPDPWPRLITCVLFSDGCDDSSALYELRLRVIGRGAYCQPPMFPANLLDVDPPRCVGWLESRLQREIASRSEQLASPDELAKDEPLGGEKGRHLEDLLGGQVEFDLNIYQPDTLNRLAAAVPNVLWERLLPCVLRLSELTRRTPSYGEPGEFFPDAFWSSPLSRRRVAEPTDLVAALALAGALLTVDDAEFLRRQFCELSAHSSRTVQQLLARLLLLCPGRVADFATEWLCDRPARFSLGDAGPDRWWYAQELIRSFAPDCSSEVYARLEAAILEYHDPLEYRNLLWEREQVAGGYPARTNWYGLAQHALLVALPQGRISLLGQAALAQWREKFGVEAVRFIRKRVGGFRSSVLPLSAEQARQLTDEQWIEVIRTHPETLGVDHYVDVGEDHFTTHDANHYAHVLGLFARWQQRRCAELALRLPPESNPQYLLAILHALWNREPPDPRNTGDWDPVTPDQVVRLVESIGYKEHKEQTEIALAWCQTVRQWSEVEWPCSALDALCRYATDHPDPGKSTRPVPSEGGTDLQASRLNCVRGAATDAIEAILFDRPGLYDFFLPTIERVVADLSPIVRVAAVGACLPVINHDREKAVNLFLRACDTEDAVLACRDVGEFLFYTLQGFRELLEPLVRRMTSSANPSVARLGAQWVTVGWLNERRMDDLLQECALSGSAFQRRGVAEVAAQSVGEDRVVPGCVELLPLFFEDPDREVRQAAAIFLRHGSVLGNPATATLATDYVRTQAFRDHPRDLLDTLVSYGGSLMPFADLVFEVCEAFAGPLAGEARDLREGLAYDITLVPPMLLRLYEQAEQTGQRDVQTRCLDSWDNLLRARIGGVRELLRALDRDE